MYKEHPEIVVTRLGGQYLYYGLRQNTDLLNPTYRFYCDRIIRKILEHYKNNPAIIGFQIDNETSSAGAANHDMQVGFQEYLKAKFHTVDDLDRKSTRLNSSHITISYAVFCLKKKNKQQKEHKMNTKTQTNTQKPYA